MNLFAPNEEKARKALEAAVSKRSLISADLEAHRLAPADPGDFDARKKWLDREASLTRDFGLADEVVEHWRGVSAKLEQGAAERAADAEHSQALKLPEEHEKVTREIGRLSVSLAEKIARSEEIRRSIEAANAKRGNRAPILDGEARIRCTVNPAVPPVMKSHEVWLDASGNVVKLDITDDEGEWIKNPAAVRRETREYEYSAGYPATTIPLRRFADEVRLVNIGGDQIWPPR